MSSLTARNMLTMLLVSGVGLLAVGCNKSNPTSEAQSLAKTETAASQPGPNPNGDTVKVSITSNTPPFAFMNEKGAPQGIDVDMINEIAKLEGFNVQYVPTSWDGMFADIEAGKSDLAVSGISYTAERSAKYGVSHSYFYNPSSIVSDATKGNFNSLEALQGKRVAGLSGGKSKQYAESVKNAQLTIEETPFLLYQQIIKGNADAAIYDQPVWTYLSKQYPQYKVNIVPLEKQDDPNTQTVVITPKAKTQLLSKINQGIAKLQQTGKLAEIEKKYMGTSQGSQPTPVAVSAVKPS